MAYIVVIIFIVGFVAILFYASYSSETNSKSKLITFKQFKDFYMIAPENWNINCVYENEVKYKPTCIKFRFNFIDYLRFKHFKEHPTYDKDIEIFLASVQNDIKQYKTEKRKEFNNKIDNIEKERKEKRL